MKNKVYSYSAKIDVDFMKKAILNISHAGVRQIPVDIASNNYSLLFEYQGAMNNILASQITNPTDSTIKKNSCPDSSFCQQDDNVADLIKLEILSNSTTTNETKTFKNINNKIFEKKLLAIMNGENYTSGEVCASEIFVESTIQQVGADCAMAWLMQIYEVNYNRPNILIGILHMLSHFSYSTVKPYGPIMALALLQHKSIAVREFAVKAFENWNSKDSLVFLKNIKCDQTWLQNYLDEVISDIENDK